MSVDSMSDNNVIWSDYISRYGIKPKNASQLQAFSKTDSFKYTPLNYKTARMMFDKFNAPKVEQIGTKKDNNKVPIKKGIHTTKDTSQSNTKTVNIVQKEREKEKKRAKNEKKEEKKDVASLQQFKHKKNTSKPSSTQAKKVDKYSAKYMETHDTDSDSILEIEKFVEAERVYVKCGLRICYETFLHRLEIHDTMDDSIINKQNIGAIFGNYSMLYHVNNKLFDDLMEIRLNEGMYALRDKLGQIMVDFIPYFKIYTDYIVNKHRGIARLEELKKSNNKFKQFLKINETCVKRKLKSFLEEPVHRLPQYLVYLGKIYELYKNECIIHNVGQQLLLQSIVDIKNVSDEIALKCKDLKSRILLGRLQKDWFGNKIQILSAHRRCIAHCSFEMILHNEKKVKSYNLILCNDILLISTLSSTFKSGNLVSVHPLIGLRILAEALHNEYEYVMSILPSNDTIICETEKEKLKWLKIIEEAVEEQEHSFKQCNVVDLEKRIRKQKTSKEGESDFINITDPHRIKLIKAWRNKKYGIKDNEKLKTMDNTKQKRIQRSPPKATSNIAQNKAPKVNDKVSPNIAQNKAPKVNDKVSPIAQNKASKVNDNTYTTKDKDSKGMVSNEITRRKSNARMNLLSGISSFKVANLKQIDAETLKTKAECEPQNMTNLLQSTLHNYRQFVMDDDDDDDESDNEWSD